MPETPNNLSQHYFFRCKALNIGILHILVTFFISTPKFVLEQVLRSHVSCSHTIITSKTPCLAMNERARKKYVCFLYHFWYRLQRFPIEIELCCTCAVRTCNYTTCDLRKARSLLNHHTKSVFYHSPTYNVIDKALLRYNNAVRTCICTPTVTVKRIANGSSTIDQIPAQCVQMLPRYGRGMRRCKCRSQNVYLSVPNHTPTFSIGYTTTNGSLMCYQTSTLPSQPLPNINKRHICDTHQARLTPSNILQAVAVLT